MNFSRNCEGVVRRDCLRLGLGTLFGGGLVDGLRLRGMAARKGGSTAPAKSCILIWMDGGPTHFETFDIICRIDLLAEPASHLHARIAGWHAFQVEITGDFIP